MPRAAAKAGHSLATKRRVRTVRNASKVNTWHVFSGRDKRDIGGRGRPVIANQNSQAISGIDGTSIASGAANAINRRGGSAIANQKSTAVSGELLLFKPSEDDRFPCDAKEYLNLCISVLAGAGGVSIADGQATAVSSGGNRRRKFCTALNR